jgi:hypothetical protein
MPPDPYALDRQITDAGRAVAAARAALQTDPEATGPRPLAAHDRVTRRDAVIEIADLAARREGEPLWAAAVPWMQALTLSRATFVDARREAIARRSERFAIEEPVRAEVTVEHALRQAITAPSAELARAWARVVEGAPLSTRDAAVLRDRRRREAARLLGEVDLDALDVPVAEPALAERLARDVLSTTDGLVQPSASWRDAIVAALAREGQDGYPARLTARWIAAALPPGLFAGLSFDPGPAPALLGASSVARALSAVAARAALLDRPAGLPACIARAPSDLLVARRAALFGGLVADPVFVRRALGASRAAAGEQAARAARALVVWVRSLAAKTLLRGATTPDELVALGSDAFGRALGAAVPGTIVGVVPRLDPGACGDGAPGAAAALVGVVVAAIDRERVIDALDEDWFASPRAADLLRHEHHAHRAASRASRADLDAGLAALRRALAGA